MASYTVAVRLGMTAAVIVDVAVTDTIDRWNSKRIGFWSIFYGWINLLCFIIIIIQPMTWIRYQPFSFLSCVNAGKENLFIIWCKVTGYHWQGESKRDIFVNKGVRGFSRVKIRPIITRFKKVKRQMHREKKIISFKKLIICKDGAFFLVLKVMVDLD